VTNSSVNIAGAAVSFGSLPQNPTPPICMDGKTYAASTGSTTYNGANLYRTAKAVYYVGLAPNSLNTVELNGLASKNVSYYKGDSRSSNYVPGQNCGIFYIDLGRNFPPNLKIDSVSYSATSLPAAASHSCSANLSPLVPNTLYYPANPDFYGNNSFVYRVTDLAKKKISVEYPTIVSRNLPVNACGFAQIDSLNKVNGFEATDKVKINGTQYTISTLPLAPGAPICRNGVTYQAVP
jgi:hypothetical protein